MSVCETCRSIDREHCRFRDIDAGCDHPDVQTEMAAMFADLLSGKIIAQNEAAFDAWMRAHGYSP